MNDEQVDALLALVETYLLAHRERIKTEPGDVPKLWAGRPIRGEYRAVLKFVQDLPECASRYSAKKSESLVDDMLRRALEIPGSAAEEVREMADALNHPLVTKLYIPLDGVAIDAAEYEVGALKIIRMDDATHERLILRPAADVMSENPRYNDKVRAGFIELQRKQMESLRGRVCAEISTNLDIDRTFEFANASVTAALCDFLQFGASLFVPWDKRLKIRWATDAPPSHMWYFAASDGPTKNTNTYKEVASTLFPFEVTAGRIAQMEGWHLNRIANLVGRDAPTEYDELLQAAVRWYAKGEREEHIDDRKLSYVTAVDLFFSSPGRGTTNRICKGFAFSLAADDDSVALIARYMLRIFNSRSATSHSGDLGIMDAEELETLRHRVKNCVIAMASREFHSKVDIARWIGERERALSPEQRQALRDATDFRTNAAEARISLVVSTLRGAIVNKLFSEDDAKRAYTISNLFVNALRVALTPGVTWVRDLAAHATEDLDALSGGLCEKMDAKTADADDAATYLAGIITRFEGVTWVRDALAGPEPSRA